MMSSPTSTSLAAKRDYWQLALASLEPKSRKSLSSASTSKLDVATAALKAAQGKRETCLKERWQFKKSNGEIIIVRDVLEKIVKWVNKFKEVGDNAVQYDTAHAALPWAGVRFLLLVAVNDIQIFGAMAENLEVVSRLIACYTVFEKLYLSRSSGAIDQVEESLIKLYASILTFLAEAIRYYEDKTLGIMNFRTHHVIHKLTFIVRTFKSLLRDTENPMMQKMIAQEAEVLKLARLLDTETLINIQEIVVRLSEQARISEKTVQEQQMQEIRRWISSIDFTSLHETVCETRLAGTGKWLLDNPVYRSWRVSSSSSILLLHGIPGCGKTKLSSVVIDSFLSERQKHAAAAPFAYFYCARYETERARGQADEILRSVVRQLAMSGDPKLKVKEVLLSEFERRQARCKVEGYELTRLRVQDCVRLILDITNHDPVTIVIDALDEVQDHDRLQLLKAFHQVVADSNNVAKIFFSSRDHNDVFASLSAIPKIRIQSRDNREDLKDFTYRLLDGVDGEEKLFKDQTAAEFEKLTNMLLDAAGEMFLWIKLQLDYLRRMSLEEDRLDAIRHRRFFTLDEMYMHIVDKMLSAEPAARDMAVKTISWLLYAQEPLDTKAFISAVSSTDSDVAYIAMACLNLVVIDSRSGIRFAHQSVQEFVRSVPVFMEPQGHGILATKCLQTCMMGYKTDSLEPLYRYCAIYWAHHYKRASSIDLEGILLYQVTQFIYEDDESEDVSWAFETWLESVQQISAALGRDNLQKSLDAVRSIDFSPLFTVCVYGLGDLFNHIESKRSGMNGLDHKNLVGQTGLYLAAAYGHADIVHRLIQQGADYNIQCGRQGSPLVAACYAGHLAVVQVLLEAGVSMSYTGLSRNPIQAAARGHHEDVVLCLLESALQKQILDQHAYDLAASSASEAGFLSVLEWLHKLPNGQSTPEKTMARVVKAIRNGQVDILRRIISKSTTSPTILPPDGISTAALYDKPDMVTFLLDEGLNVEQEGLFGSPLRCTGLMNHERIAQTLLAKHANVNANGEKGDALQAAAMKGHAQMARLLMDVGADVNQTGGPYGNALQAAAYCGHIQVVEMLLNRGASIDQTGFTKDAFHAAAEGGHEEIVAFLLTKGYKFERLVGCQARMVLPSPYKALLRDASPSRKDNRPIRAQNNRLCISEPGMPNLKGKVLELSLENTFKALEQPTHTVERPDSGIDQFVDPANGEIFALLVATSANQHSVVRFLLERQRALGLTNDEIGNAFIHAAENGNIGMVQLFLDSSRASSRFLRNAFDMAANAEQLATMETLLNYFMKTGEDAKELVQTLLCSRHSSVAKIGLDMLYTHLTQSEQVDARTTALKNICAQTRLSDGGSQVFGLLIETQPSLGVEILVQSFMTACRSGNAQAARIVSGKAGRNHFQDGVLLQMLLSCASQGHLELVPFLVDQMSPQANGIVTGEVIIVASGHGHVGVVEFLLGRMERCEELEKTLAEALLVASEAGHPKVVKRLIQAGADVTAIVELVPPRCVQEHCLRCRGPYGALKRSSTVGLKLNALQACLRGLSLSNGRLPEPRRHHRWTKGDFAEREAVLQLLLSHGADPNVLGGCDDYPIIYAAANCSVSGLTELINNGADVNVTNSDTSALRVAASRELSAHKVLKRLLNAGADIPNSGEGAKSLMNEALNYFFGGDRSGHPGGRFLHADSLEYVFEEGPGAVVETLLSCLPDMRACDKRYELVLQMASFLNRHETVTLLLQRGVDVNAVGYYYGTALQAASRCGHSKMVKLLLGARANVKIRQGRHQTALCAAIVGCHVDIVETLVQAGADMSLHFDPEQSYAIYHKKTPTNALQLAVRARRLDIVELLLDAGVDVYEDVDGHEHPLLTACESGDLEIVTALLDAGFPVNVSEKMRPRFADSRGGYTSPIHKASAKGHANIVRVLVARGADAKHVVDGSNGNTPLEAAASTGQSECVRALLAAGLNTDGSICGAALLEASRGGHVEVARELLYCDVSVQVQADALIQACHERHYRLIELLIESMAALNTDSKDHAITAALEVASSSQDEKLWSFLLEYKNMDPEILVHACIAGSLPSVKTALSCMIQVDSEDTRGRRGLHAAAYGLHASVVKELIHDGTDVNYDHPLYGSPLVTALEGCLERRLVTLEDIIECDNLNATSDDASHPSSKELAKESKQLAQERVGKQETEPARHRREIRSRRWVRTPSGQVEKDFAECRSIFRDLLAGGAECDTKFGSFGNALHLAAFSGDATLVRLLLDNGADVNACGGYFGNALFAALKDKHASVVDLLLARKIYTHTSFNGGLTPLHCACLEEFAGAVCSLLGYGADTNARDNQNRTTMSCALSAQPGCSSRLYNFLPGDSSFEETAAGTLLKYGKAVEISEDDLVTSAALESKFRQPEPLKILLRHDGAITVTERVLLAVLGRTSVDRGFLEFLIERSAGLGVTESMLRSTGDGDVMEVLLRQQAICNITTPILEAQGDWRCVELLLEHDTQMVPTQAVLVKALEADDSCRRSNCIENLWKRNPNFKVSDDILKVTRYSNDMQFLLDRYDPQAPITTEVLAAVLGGYRYKQHAEILRLLLNHDEGLQVSTDLVLKSFGVADAVEVLKVLLEHNSAIIITEEMLLKMFVQVWYSDSRKEKMVELMQRFGKTVKVTVDNRAELLKACDAHSEPGMRGLVSSLMV